MSYFASSQLKGQQKCECNFIVQQLGHLTKALWLVLKIIVQKLKFQNFAPVSRWDFVAISKLLKFGK